MKKYFFAFILALGAGRALEAGTIPLYENFGTVTNVPQVDAVAFANYGQFNIFSTLPYDTQNTLYFTNRGTMNGVPGFRFDHVADNRIRDRAINFINLPGASVLGGAGSQTFSFGGASPFFFGGSLENPALIASATNV